MWDASEWEQRVKQDVCQAGILAIFGWAHACPWYHRYRLQHIHGLEFQTPYLYPHNPQPKHCRYSCTHAKPYIYSHCEWADWQIAKWQPRPKALKFDQMAAKGLEPQFKFDWQHYKVYRILYVSVLYTWSYLNQVVNLNLCLALFQFQVSMAWHWHATDSWCLSANTSHTQKGKFPRVWLRGTAASDEVGECWWASVLHPMGRGK